MVELGVGVPPVEFVSVDAFRIDNENPNRMSRRKLEALRKSIQRYGFVVPIITNKNLLVADGEHRLKAARALGMKQVSVVRLPVDEVDRRMIRQVMNKLRGEHDLFMDETDVRIDNLLKLREPAVYSDDDLKKLAEKFNSRIESNKLDTALEREHAGEPLTLKCHIEFSTKAEITERTLAVCEAFGLGVDEAKHFLVFDNFSLDFNRGDLIYVTGDSGGGKSLLLKAFKGFFGDDAVELSDLEINPEETLIEGIGRDVKEAIEILSLCGLNDAFLFLRRFKELSDGQKYRYKLAKLVDCKDRSVWLVDEFCVCLDRVMARVVAFLFQKVARRLGKTVVVASAHDDLICDFQPDVVVKKGFEGEVEVERNEVKPRICSICKDVRIEKGSIEDYEKLKRFHYRSKNEKERASLRVKDCYRLLYGDSLIGVIVYSHSYLNLKSRNMVFGDRYQFTPGDLQKARLVNDEIARISRVIIHPKFRGIGLGEFLVRETLPKVGAKIVEVLAVMARYNPFFERAGMLKIEYRRDESLLNKKIEKLLEEHGFDFRFAKSERYCRSFFGQLEENKKGVLLSYLSEFARQPFVKMKVVTPDLIGRAFSSDGIYLYWIKS
jgi:ABC-type transport system involved in cytochrome c biogenesis ATPase subunit/GNAT superfamily N-acetyltransferase